MRKGEGEVHIQSTGRTVVKVQKKNVEHNLTFPDICLQQKIQVSKCIVHLFKKQKYKT